MFRCARQGMAVGRYDELGQAHFCLDVKLYGIITQAIRGKIEARLGQVVHALESGRFWALF